MATPKKKPNPAGLIAIANPNLAKKLNDDEQEASATQADPQAAKKKALDLASFEKDKWKAVLTLNMFRYALALYLIGLITLPRVFPNFASVNKLLYPGMFKIAAITLLISAVCFTIFTSTKKFTLSQILTVQFVVDVLLAGALVHATGSIESNFSLLFFIIVTTGSVVLRRKHALALASGATIMLFYEHVYSFWRANAVIEAKLDTLAVYCVILMIAGWSISYLASRLRNAELKSYVPGSESIEEFLVREEKAALAAALESTNGNKTEAAKLIGMSFRSFRYKLTKYDMG